MGKNNRVHDKSNELSQFLVSHFEKKINLARIKLISMLMIALCKIQTVNLTKLAVASESEAKSASVLRRIQRFLSSYYLDKDLISTFIYRLLPHQPPYRLAMDRTSWEVSGTEINVLVLSVLYQGLSFPILFSCRLGKGNSNWQQRKKLMERFITLFGKENIDSLLADREFVGSQWMKYLIQEKINFYLRMKGNYIVTTCLGYPIPINRLFLSLKMNEPCSFKRCFYQKGVKCYLTGMKVKGQNGIPDLIVIATREKQKEALDIYKTRWQIETSFKALKTSGFNMEQTHVKNMERIENLFAILCMTLAWCYAIGVHVDANIKPIRILNTGRRAYSLFKYGLNYICRFLLTDNKANRYSPIKFLSCI